MQSYRRTLSSIAPRHATTSFAQNVISTPTSFPRFRIPLRSLLRGGEKKRVRFLDEQREEAFLVKLRFAKKFFPRTRIVRIFLFVNPNFSKFSGDNYGREGSRRIVTSGIGGKIDFQLAKSILQTRLAPSKHFLLENAAVAARVFRRGGTPLVRGNTRATTLLIRQHNRETSLA